jgi:tape measure domain-containing protein
MADSLRIEIDVSAAKAALDQLSGSFSTFQQTAEKATSGASTAVQRLNDAMKNIKGIDSGVLSSLSTLNQAIANLNAGAIGTLNSALSSLGSGAQSVQQAAQAVTALGGALAAVKTPEGLASISVNFKNASSAAQDADAHVKAFYKDQAAQAAASAKAAAAAQKQLQTEFNRTQNQIKALGTELLNASGFMTGLGVTAGKIISLLSDLSNAGKTVGDVIGGLQQQFGNLGAAAAVLSGIVTSFKLLSGAVTAVVDPILKVGMQFQAFQTTIDALEGSGAGVKTLEALKQVANETAQDLGTLVKNYTGFRAATQAAGLTAADSLKIYKQFGGALTALGASAEQTDKAMLAITQMFSKGTVQAEELRGQLGDALPGAFQFAAQAIGKTDAELGKLMKNGNVLAKDLIPKLGDLLQSKFGDAVAQQAQNAAGQIKKLNTEITTLSNDAAQGNLGGVLGGFAAGMQKLNEALNSPALAEFSKAFGDFVGILVNIGISTFAGIAKGITTIFDALVDLKNIVVTVLKPVTDFVSALLPANAAMKGIADVADLVGKAIGALTVYYIATTGATKAYAIAEAVTATAMQSSSTAAKALGIDMGLLSKVFVDTATAAKTSITNLSAFQKVSEYFNSGKAAIAGYFSTLVTGLRTASPTADALIKSFSNINVASRLGAAGMKIFTVAVEGLKFALKGIAILAVIEAISRLEPLLESVASSFYKWMTSATDASKAAEQLKSSSDVVTESLDSFVQTISKAPDKLFDAANAFDSFANAQDNAKQKSNELKDSINEMSNEIKASEAASKDAARLHQEETDSIRQQIDVINQQKTAVQKLDNAYGGSKTNTKNFDFAIKDLNESLKNSEFQFREQERSTAAWRDSIKEAQDAAKEQVATLKEYGVALDTNGLALAKELEQTGLAAKEAANYAYAVQQATKSETELSQESDDYVAKLESKVKALENVRDTLSAAAQKEKETVIAAGGSKDAAEAAAKGYQDLADAAGKSIDADTKKIAGMKAVSKVLYDHKTIEEAVKEAVQETADELGKSVSQSDAMKSAQEQLSKTLGQTAKSAADAGKATKSWGDILKGVVERLFSTGESSGTTATNVQKVSDAFSGAQKVLESASSTLGNINESFTSTSTAADTLSNSLPEISGYMSDISDGLPDLAENLATVNPLFDQLSIDSTNLSTNMPVIQTSFEGISTTVAAGSDALAGFVGSLGRIPGMADGIVTTSQALSAFIDKIVSSQDSIAQAVTALEKLGAAALGTKDGFDAAIAAGDKMIDELNDIEDAVGDLITAMNKLYDAASRALTEALKAKAAQSDSGGGDSAGSGRYGGMSGNLPETQTVSPGAFGGAPAFKDGTANTSSFLSKVPGGGIPSILHPNEAVVPLPKGRKIPVDLKIQQMPSPSAELSKTNVMDFKPLQTSLTDVSKSLSDVADALKTPPQALPDAQIQMPVPQIKLEAPKVPTSAQLNTPPQGRDTVRSSPDGLTPTLDSRASNNGSGKTVEKHITQPINITIQTQDADSFKRSKDQVAKQLSDSIKKANRRIGN